MFPPSSTLRRVLLAAALVAAGGATPPALSAQLAPGVLSPAGRLRLELAPTFDLWSERFGRRAGPQGLIEEVEPLGFDVERFPIGPLRAGLEAALGDATGPLELGSTRALVSRDRTRIAFGAALGIFDWLTVGASVPIVKPRTEVAVDFRSNGGVGANPRLTGGGRVFSFLSELNGAGATLRTLMMQSCPASPDCAALTDLHGRYMAFAGGLDAAYQQSTVFVTAGSAAGTAIQQHLAGLAAEVAERAPDIVVPTEPPFAATALDQEGLEELLTGVAGGYQLLQPFEQSPAVWRLGDVEVSAALRLLEGESRDSAGATRFGYRVGVLGLARLPTGETDDPDLPLDFGTGDGQLDLEGGAFADVRWARFGMRAEGRYGVQQGTDLLRRAGGPDEVFVPIVQRRLVRWKPGSYLALEAAPSWYLTDELALGASYGFWSKQADTYRTAFEPGIAVSGDNAQLLGIDTEGTLHQLGLGLAFSTLSSWRAGRAPVPLEVSLAVRRGVAGSGGAVPKGTRMEATGRVFWRLWGSEPAADAAATGAR